MRYTLFILFAAFLHLYAGAQQVNENIDKGNTYYREGKFDLAEQQYNKALKSEPGNRTAMYNLANTWQKQKKYEEAAKLLEQLGSGLKPSPLLAAVRYNTGVAQTKLKDLEQAIAAYKASLRINPEDKDVRENLEKALLELKKQQNQQKKPQKQDAKMNQKEAEQKLKLLAQKENNLQERLQNQSHKKGNVQPLDW